MTYMVMFAVLIAVTLLTVTSIYPSLVPVVPDHIMSFCQAQFEVYEIPYDKCIESYKAHQLSQVSR